MTGAEHYLAAERLVAAAMNSEFTTEQAPQLMAAAQVHATLALAAATAEQITTVEISYLRGEQWDLVLDGQQLSGVKASAAVGRTR